MKRALLLILLLICMAAAGSGRAMASLVDDANTIALWHMDAWDFFSVVDFVTDAATYTDNWLRGARSSGNAYVAINYLQLNNNPPGITDPCHPVVIVHSVADGNALSFSGAQLAFSQTASWKSTYPAFTVDMQFNAQRATGAQTLLEATNVWNISLSGSDAALTVYTSGSPRVYTIAGAVALGTWQHIIASCTAAGHVTFQVDALTAVTGDGLPLKSLNASIYMANTKGSSTNWFKGYIDEVKISVPNLQSIVINFTSPSVDSGSTLGLWHFDAYNATWGISDDDSTKPTRNADWPLYRSDTSLINSEPVPGYDGVWLADPTVAGSGDYTDPAIGYPANNPAFGKCIYFDGYSGNAHTAASVLPIDGQNMLISFWFRLPNEWTANPAGSANRTLAIVDRWNQIAINILDWSSTTPTSNGVNFEVQLWDNNGSGYWDNKVKYNVSTRDYHKWQFWQVKSVGNIVTVYADGTLVATYTLTTGLKRTFAGAKTYIGLRSWSNLAPFWGYIDDLRIARAVPTCGDLGYNAMDFNQDCVVDFKDLVVVVQDWVKSDNPLPATNGTENYPAVTATGWADLGNYSIPQATVTPTIDGVFHASEWADARPIEMVYPALSTLPNVGGVWNHPEWGSGAWVPPTSPADYSLFWYVKWDTNYLYVAGVIYDSSVVATAGNDEPQLCFNFRKDLGHNYLTQAFVWNFRSDNTWNTNGGPTPSSNTVFSRTNNPAGLAGYVIEAKIKWSDLEIPAGTGYVPAVGDTHGFGFVCADMDAGTTIQHWMTDFGKGDEIWNIMSNAGLSTWNTIKLVNTMPCYEKEGLYKGDLNQSCKVDMGDFANFAQQWLNCMDGSGAKCKM